MLTRLRRWGNSLGLRIPRPFAQQADVTEGSEIDLSLEKGRLIVTPVRKARYDLEGLLAGITRRNRHPEWDSGDSRGRETL